MATHILQHPSSPFRLQMPAAWVQFADNPGISPLRRWVCTKCKISLMLRSKATCFACGQPMKESK